MPSDQTTKATIHFGTWDESTRAHPAMKWMENYTRHIVDEAKWDEPVDNWHVQDFTFTAPSGAVVTGAEQAWKAVEQMYSPFKAFRHEPTFIVYWDYEGGEGREWGMMGAADVWFRLQGLSGDAVTDKEGGKWDGSNSGAFLFHYIKDGDSIKLKSTKIFADSSPALKLMLQNNMIDAETLKRIVVGS